MRNSPRTRKLEQILCDSTHLPGAGTFHVTRSRARAAPPRSLQLYALYAARTACAWSRILCNPIRRMSCNPVCAIRSEIHVRARRWTARPSTSQGRDLPSSATPAFRYPHHAHLPWRLHAPWPSHARALTVSLPMPLDARPRRGSMQPRRARTPAALCRSPHLALDGAKFMSSAKRSSGWNSSISGACGMWHSSVAFIPFIIAPISRFPMPMWFVIKLNMLYCPL